LGELENVEEILQRPGQPAQLGEHHRVDAAQLDVPHEALEGRAVGGLGAYALIDVGLHEGAPVFALEVPAAQLSA
jgi:hypothetical protein